MSVERLNTHPDETPKIQANLRIIHPNELDFILKSKKSELAKMYLYWNESWRPYYTLVLDWKARRSLSKKIWGEHDYIVWYCFLWDELRARTFWRSNSEWCRRAWLWEETSSNYSISISKWQSIKNATYETTTKIDYIIAKELDKINLVVKSDLHSDPYSSLPINGRKICSILTPQMVKEIKIDKLYEKYPFLSSCGIITWQDINVIKQWFKNIKLKWINLASMKLKKDWIYSYKHKFLWIIDVHICEIDWNGTLINIHFAKSRSNNPEKVWIDDMTYPDAKINSFWTHDRQINAAPLTAKPIEYKSQSPKWMEVWHQTFEWYVDIRDLYQENPLIRRFKEIAWIK